MAEVSKRTFVVVSHTHWDREWYRPFEGFRVRLVRMMDSLLDLLDRDPEYRHFVLDGQTIVLDDYLEVRPERRPDVQRLVQTGRLLIGPHYVLPDEFLIGGESWVRNLQIGIRSAREFGPVMMVGYSPDAFGHIAHLPAILRGFGIDSIVLWRGVGREATRSEFLWHAPDGSEVLVLHLPFGYGIAATLPADPPGLRNLLTSLRGLLEPLATSRYVLVPNGNDHAAAQESLPHVLRTANELFDDAEFVHGHYPTLIEAIRREAPAGDLPRLEGEFRSSQRSHVLAGVLSARVWIKQRYQQCEDLLARYAEPLAAWAHLLRLENGEPGRGPSDQALLRQAWRLLLQNAPHDSICGCSIDQVHEEMRPRFDRCQQIAEAVLYESQRHIADLASRPGGSSVVVFNSEGGPRTDFCTVRLALEDPPKGDSGKLPSSLVDSAGRSVPLQLLERGLRSPLDARERIIAGFVASDVPAYGYRAYQVEYGGARREKRDRRREIENEFFRVTADPADGTLTVEDLRSGTVFSGLNRFVDGGDRGDEYTYCPPKDDDLIDSPSRPPQVRITERGPARWTLEVVQTYSLPSSLAEDRDARSRQRAECRIVSRASLCPGVARVDIETEVDNRAQDHRLRVQFPTGVRTEHTHAEQHFGVLCRPVAPAEDDGMCPETPIATYPQKSFVDVSDGRRGLTVANRGLPEYEALQETDGTVTIALTLLRCVGWLSRTDIRTRRGPAGPSLEAPGAQMPGRWTFHYSVIPHAGAVPAGRQGWETSFQDAHRFARPPWAVRTDRGAGDLPPQGSLLDIEPPALVLSSLKIAEDGDAVVARVYNTSDAPQEGRLRLHPRPGRPSHASAQMVDLNEEPLGPADMDDGWVKLSARPNQILTVRFTRA